jgi:hypothetical protein
MCVYRSSLAHVVADVEARSLQETKTAVWNLCMIAGIFIFHFLIISVINYFLFQKESRVYIYLRSYLIKSNRSTVASPTGQCPKNMHMCPMCPTMMTVHEILQLFEFSSL